MLSVTLAFDVTPLPCDGGSLLETAGPVLCDSHQVTDVRVREGRVCTAGICRAAQSQAV